MFQLTLWEWLFHIFPVAAVIAYLVATSFYLRLFSGKSDPAWIRRGRRCLMAGLVLHVSFLVFETMGFYRVGAPERTIFELPFALSLTSILVVLLFLVFEQRFRASVLGGFVAPIGVVFMLASSLLYHIPREVSPVSNSGVLLWLHVGLAVLANAIFVLAFAVSLAIIVQESFLKGKKVAILQWKLPSLQGLDALCGKLLSVGFFLMLLGVSTGMLFAHFNKVVFFRYDSRIVSSLGTLGMYAILLFMRVHYGWRGSRAAWLAVAGFSAVVASFVGVYWFGGTFHSY